MTTTSYARAMRARARRWRAGAGLLALVLAVAGCNLDLDLTDPNSPTENTALSSVEGVVATSLGMQDQFAISVNAYVRAPALVTDEWGPTSRALAADLALFSGEGIDPTFGTVSGPYYSTFRVVRTAEAIIANVPRLQGIGGGLAAGLTANARLFKAMALGMAAQQYERLPITASSAGAPLLPRAEVFTEVIRLLEAARTDLAGVTDAELAGFRNSAVSPGFDLRNTIDAMLARYYLFTGQYQAAIDAAARVDLTVVSVLTYPDPAVNPIHDYSVIAGYVAPLQSFVNEAEPGDQRVPFWVNVSGTPPVGNPPTLGLRPFQFYATRNAPFPVYLPGEMLLVQAEAHARLGRLGTAVEFINRVRTKAGTANTPGARLAPVSAITLDTEAEVLAQVAYERRYELFSQGLRWEDLRRLGQYVGRAPKATFLPTPQGECQSNPNANCGG